MENKKVLIGDMEIAKAFNDYFSNFVQTWCNRVEKTSTDWDIVCFLSRVYTYYFYVLVVYILVHISINLYIRKQHISLLRNDDLYSTYTF